MRRSTVGSVSRSPSRTVTGKGKKAARLPIIDVHLHAQELWAKPGEDAGVTFGPVFAR